MRREVLCAPADVWSRSERLFRRDQTGPNPIGAPALGADDEQWHAIAAALQDLERVEQRCVVLARFERADRDQVGGIATECCRGSAPAAFRADGESGHVIDPERDY